MSAMHHCNTHVGWYFGKFLLGFAGILVVYAGFIKEKDITCLCKAAARQWRRKSARENENSSPEIQHCAVDVTLEEAPSRIRAAVRNRKKSSSKKCRNQKSKISPCPHRAIVPEDIDKTARCLEYVKQQRNYCIKMQNRKNRRKRNLELHKNIKKSESLRDNSKFICDPSIIKHKVSKNIQANDELESECPSTIVESSTELQFMIKFGRDDFPMGKSDNQFGVFYQNKIENAQLLSAISPWRRKRRNNCANFLMYSKHIRSFRIQNMKTNNSKCS